jgi:putative colanic acid biosynthesis glycosyltransferase
MDGNRRIKKNMIKILQISVEGNRGSVGSIAEAIGLFIMKQGWESYIAFGRFPRPSKSQLIRIGSNFDVLMHGLKTRLFDAHGLASKIATQNLINQIKEIRPNVIHLHHLHGYFININILFEYLSLSNIPVIWTFHDCWAFTGHCTHFEFVGCEKWQIECHNCEQKNEYPKSLLFDRSRKNFLLKKKIFNSVNNLTIIPVSNWLEDKVKVSFLNKYSSQVVKNGIDLGSFYPKNSKKAINALYNLNNRFIILGVASTWGKKKGLEEFHILDKYLNKREFVIILVGLSNHQLKKIPGSIVGIRRTENLNQLADLYSAADVFVNPTFEDTYPTTNLESIACGTPVITYNTGGSVESVNERTGIIVSKGNTLGLLDAIKEIKYYGKSFYEQKCRKYAEENFNNKDRFNDYIEIYKKIISTSETRNENFKL